MATTPFEEKQTFHWVVYASLLLIFAVMCGAALTAPGVSSENLTSGQTYRVPLVFACGLLLTTNVLFMHTTIDEKELVVQFGYCFPIYRKRIPLGEIRHARVVEYRPIRNAGGWGIRFGRFEQERCRFLNCRGKRGVLLETPKLQWIIGSQQPERLLAALKPEAERSGASR